MEYAKESGNIIFCAANYRATTDTPLPTPTHRYNVWADDRKSLGITPHPTGTDEEEVGGVKFKTDQEREEWEEEQKVRGQYHYLCGVYFGILVIN